MAAKVCVASQLQSENDALKTTIVCLRREIENRQGAVARLEVLLCERLTRIDELTGTIDQLRAANQKLHLENHCLTAMLAAPPLDAAMLAPK
jgi:hypothetical protein